MTIQVFELRISKDDLARMPADERSLLILAGHASNQIVTLIKLVILTMNFESVDNVHASASAVQTHTLLRFLFGALAESYELVRTRFLAKPMSAEYVGMLSDEGRAALQFLKKYFGSRNAIIDLRNDLAFHYPSDELVAAAFATSPKEDAAWAIYLSDKSANSLYFLSDFVIFHGLVDVANAPNLAEAFAKVMDEVTRISDAMTDLLMAIIEAIIVKHLPDKLAELPSPHEIIDAPKLREFRIPFFFER